MEKTEVLRGIDSLYRVNLNVGRNEKELVFTDLIREDETTDPSLKEKRRKLEECAEIVAREGKKYAPVAFLKFPATGKHGGEPPLEIWKLALGKAIIGQFEKYNLLEKLLKKEMTEKELQSAHRIVSRKKDEVVDVVIALSWFSSSHTSFRELLTESGETRYASMPLFEPEMFSGAMAADWQAVSRRTIALGNILEKGVKIELSSPRGTDMQFGIKGRKVGLDTGILDGKQMRWGNLPGGEAFVSPLEGTAEGRLVIEWAPTRKLSEPITLRVEEGRVSEVKGEESYARELQEQFGRDPRIRNIAEVGIGTNDKARRFENIVEAEKILGTVHVALGDNSTIGGRIRASVHEDYVVREPTLIITLENGEKKTILEKGKLKVLFPR